jgi:hypothetical protein
MAAHVSGFAGKIRKEDGNLAALTQLRQRA